MHRAFMADERERQEEPLQGYTEAQHPIEPNEKHQCREPSSKEPVDGYEHTGRLLLLLQPICWVFSRGKHWGLAASYALLSSGGAKYDTQPSGSNAAPVHTWKHKWQMKGERSSSSRHTDLIPEDTPPNAAFDARFTTAARRSRATMNDER
ncbi:hypothetical protein TIFTF001_015370 [Ficus carica]|uniref:Uncharacterized protein n=1 Tax=Ficus carica TaxID=3494 RepID=A0AA88D7T7_FICCA|nr:hypothetical protein TIFTF001_015370 [Ficus carica]